MKKGIDYIGVGVGAVIINEKNEILLLKRIKDPEKGFWTIPGGSVEFGETIEDAIIREVHEEIAVKIKIIDLLGVTNHILKDVKKHWVAPSFFVKIISGIPVNKEPQSHEDIDWFPINLLPENATLTTIVAVEKYIDYISK